MPKHPLIAREEWDFNAHDGYEGCPEEEVKFCFVYEFARASGEVRAAIEDVRTGGVWPEMLPWDNVQRRRGLPYLTFLRHFPEFPAAPWLAIERTVRTERITALPEYDPPILRVPRSYVGRGRRSRDWVPRQRYTTEIFKINWAYSTSDLKEAFALWAKNHRPPKYPEDQTHGRTDERDWLKKLGAKRLLDTFGSYKDASEFSTHFLTYAPGGAKVALYARPQAWKRAADEAAALIMGKYPEDEAMRLISKIGFQWLPPEQVNKFFPWVGTEKPGTLAALLKLPIEECKAQIGAILKDR